MTSDNGNPCTVLSIGEDSATGVWRQTHVQHVPAIKAVAVARATVAENKDDPLFVQAVVIDADGDTVCSVRAIGGVVTTFPPNKV